MTAVYILLAVGAALAIYAIAEAKWLRVRTIDVTDAPASMRGQTVAVFSDVHLGLYVTNAQLRRCKNKINRENPDYILFGGDFADKFKKNYLPIREEAGRILKEMKASRGKYAVYGNNDCHTPEAAAFSRYALHKGGFSVLENDCVKLTPDAYLLGLAERKYGHPDMEKALRRCPEHAYKIVLEHAPDLVIPFSEYGVNMQISGHSHGGQVFIPFLYKHMLPPDGRIFSRGNHVVKSTRLYISYGVGVHTLPFRFLTPPDILVFKF